VLASESQASPSPLTFLHLAPLLISGAIPVDVPQPIDDQPAQQLRLVVAVSKLAKFHEIPDQLHRVEVASCHWITTNSPSIYANTL
jgi:hypothetical protein